MIAPQTGSSQQPTEAEDRSAPDLVAPAGRAHRHWLFSPGWPLAWLLYGFPVLWLLGVSSVAVMLLAVPMAIHLLRWRPLALPRGFSFWLLFLLWSAAGILVLGVNPPGTLSEPASSRLFGYVMREASYVSITVLLLYVGNIPERLLPTCRIAHMLGWMFVVTVAGGLAGLVFPSFEFTSLFEAMLPRSLTDTPYVQQLVHPKLAQVQAVIGESTPRPSAPYDYTNTWGFHVTILGVWFVARWLLGTRVHRQVLAAPVLAVGLVVLVLSFNRGAWLGGMLAVALTAAILALRGRLLPVAVVGLVAALATLVVVLSPLSTLVQQRVENGHSDSIRTFTTKKALTLSQESPIIGLGSTRNALGSHASITVGRTATCPQCGNVSIGINGYIFMLLVTTGWVGVVLFHLMWLVQMWDARGDPSPWATSAVIVLAMTIFYGFSYDVATWMMVPMVSCGILWREKRRHPNSAALHERFS